jgi:hypothetical protein
MGYKKVKSKLIVLIICSIFTNCAQYITIYSAESKANDAYIWGEDLQLFFNNTDENIDIFKTRKKISSEDVKKLKHNTFLIAKSNYVKKISGRYKYVILFKKDTFYISPSKQSWMLKNHVAIINNDSLISKIFINNE